MGKKRKVGLIVEKKRKIYGRGAWVGRRPLLGGHNLAEPPGLPQQSPSRSDGETIQTHMSFFGPMVNGLAGHTAAWVERCRLGVDFGLALG
jgi:hypothetical protein